jgi:hypothetical protein
LPGRPPSNWVAIGKGKGRRGYDVEILGHTYHMVVGKPQV